MPNYFAPTETQPDPAAPAKRSALNTMSAKQRAKFTALGISHPRLTILPSSGPKERKGRTSSVRKRNPKRKASEFAHSWPGEVRPVAGDETWRPVQGWPYEVSDRGQVRRTTPPIKGKAAPMLRPRHVVGNGYRTPYARVVLQDGRERRRCVFVHQLVLEAFVSARPAGLVCNHINGDKLDNRVENLEWTTHRENQLHAIATGLKSVAPRNVKLPRERLQEIRDRHAAGEKCRALAEEFGVDRSTIEQLVKGKTWRKPIRKRNPKRRDSEFRRAYHSRGRVSWIKLQPCMGGQPHGCSGPIENAHVVHDDQSGMGRKSGYKSVAPMCRGHHRYLHRVGPKTYEAETGISLAAIAAQTQQRWLLHCGRMGEGE